jgi:hypothetical protein
MLHLQTSNQSPETLQFGVFSRVSAVVVVVADVAAAISLNYRGDILAFHAIFLFFYLYMLYT